MANRKLGCLSIFLFVALCASVLVNLGLAALPCGVCRARAREWNTGRAFRK